MFRTAALALGLASLLLTSAAPNAVGAAEVGTRLSPDFTLSDQHGRPFTLSNERGRPVVLFFGYAHCPDVCPTILANLKRAREAVGAKGASVLVALITVDPARDTPAALGRFVTLFDPSFLGLTGSTARLAAVYRAYHVRYEKLPEEGSSDYLVSHTAFVYYIGRDGRIRGFGTWNDSQEILQENLKELVNG
jgi:protein SCO1/2